MATTYTFIASNVLSSSAASVTFSAIPATYTDLVLRITSRETVTQNSIILAFNGDSATNYSRTILFATGSAAVSARESSQTSLIALYDEDASFTANTFNSMEIYIPSYTVSQNKPLSIYGASENNATLARMCDTAGLWRNTASLNQIVLSKTGSNFVSGSSFYLYGIKNS
jgi:hypothetical protein